MFLPGIAARDGFTIVLWRFNARYPQDAGLELIITAFATASIGDPAWIGRPSCIT